ncbi:RNA polymerase sigma factor [Membranihabitans maritimus]|uniref:RNA polymerase sigma factor n=1 Tax=Membranihabitans maritimus TaxID=2904244 RepID=UPI001F1FB1F5|nr:sigma-70 family RNA polymerase sigma factor [Membranihabitans maritimus]
MNQDISTSNEREVLFKRLYREVFPEVATFIQARGGNLEDAREIFQDGLIVLYEKLISNHFQVETNEVVYLMGVVKYLWYDRYRKSQRYVKMDIHDVLSEKSEIKKGGFSKGRMLILLEQSGKKCLELLKLYYYDNVVDMEELARRFGFSGKRSATVQKYKCLEKVRNSVKEKTLQYEDFMA